MSGDRREYMREYRSRPEVKAKKLEYMREYCVRVRQRDKRLSRQEKIRKIQNKYSTKEV